jgi:anaerobic ribonucleoside-triphosphate reductase activating protein
VEDLMKDPLKKKILSYVATVVDGPFILEKKNLTLCYRGSENQRVWYLDHERKK